MTCSKRLESEIFHLTTYVLTELSVKVLGCSTEVKSCQYDTLKIHCLNSAMGVCVHSTSAVSLASKSTYSRLLVLRETCEVSCKGMSKEMESCIGKHGSWFDAFKLIIKLHSPLAQNGALCHSPYMIGQYLYGDQ